jgi:uncharacterized membrane protein YphA (DoxX/SURF4 family)
MTTLFLIGRIIFAVYLLFNGVNHFMKFKMMSDYAKMKAVPLPKAAVAGTGLILLISGLCILLGAHLRIGIGLLVIFLIATSFMMHNFWKVQDPQMKMAEMVNFLKNMALLGTVLMLAGIPRPWPPL